MTPSRREFLTLLGATAIAGNPPWQPKSVGADAWSLAFTRNILSGARQGTGSILPIHRPIRLSGKVEKSFYMRTTSGSD
ncbi:MAG TPA: hypothetical protein VI585_03175 [Candidatus Binatia bacterium]